LNALSLVCAVGVISTILSGCAGAFRGGAVGSATLTWDAPVANADGTRLTDLAGYRIYYGKSAASLDRSIDVPSPTEHTYVVQHLSTGTWYFAVAAYTTSGMESPRSQLASKTIN
jgi:hypothetical protein